MRKNNITIITAIMAALAVLMLLFLITMQSASAQSSNAVGATPARGATGASGACNPAVEKALLGASRRGAERATGIITNPNSGISQPKSVFELGCLDDIYGFGKVNILYNPNAALSGLIGQIKQRICNTAKSYYQKTVTQPFNEAVFSAKIPTLPGLQTTFSPNSKQRLPQVEVVPPIGAIPNGGAEPFGGAEPSIGQGNPDTGSLKKLYDLTF